MRLASKLTIALLLFPLAVAGQDGPRVEIEKITDDVYKITCTAGFTSNCVMVRGEEGLLLVDSGLQQTAGILMDRLEELNAGPVVYLLHTHAHSDHTGANALVGSEATIIAHDSFAANYKSGYGLLTELPEQAYPDTTFLKTYSLRFNGETIEMVHFRGGHSDGDVVISFRNSGVVCLGGLVAADQFPYLDLGAGGNIREYTKSLFKIKNMFPDNTTFVPSHGRNLTRKDLEDYLEMVKATTAAVQAGLDAGMDVEALQAGDVLSAWDGWGGGFVDKNAWIRTVADCLTGAVPERKKPVFEPLYYTAKRGDAGAAIAQYRDLKKNHPDDYDFGEANLNALGYYFLGKARYDDAIEVFRLNVDLFPESANPYDSLGEAYMKRGDRERAIECYSKALAINPEMPSAKAALEQLEK